MTLVRAGDRHLVSGLACWSSQASAYLFFHCAAYERQDYKTANECYGRALQIDPNLIPALLNRSLIALHTGAVQFR